MKAILVIEEMPDICYKCPCYDQEVGTCQASNSWKTDRENGCPLKLLPQKKELFGKLTLDKMAEYIGWNACLEEIEE